MSDRCSATHDTNDLEFRPTCEGGCGTIFEDAMDAAFTDGTNLWCKACKEEMDREALVEAAIAGQAPPMTTVEAMRLGIEAALGGNTLLNGFDPGPGCGEDDDEVTKEVEAMTMNELVFGREGRAA